MLEVKLGDDPLTGHQATPDKIMYWMVKYW